MTDGPGNGGNAIVLTAFAAAIALACSREAPPPLFEGEPGFELLKHEAAFREAFGPAPPAGFARLRYVNRIRRAGEPGERTIYEREVRALDTSGWLTKTRITSKVVHDRGEYVDEEIGIPGLVSFASRQTKRVPGLSGRTKEIRFLEIATGLGRREGSLFPLAVGRRLEITLETLYQAFEDGRGSGRSSVVRSHVFEVVDRIEGFPASPRPVPGEIFVLRVRRSDPDGSDDVEIHVSPTLGAVVLERRTFPGGGDEETRLVEWAPGGAAEETARKD